MKAIYLTTNKENFNKEKYTNVGIEILSICEPGIEAKEQILSSIEDIDVVLVDKNLSLSLNLLNAESNSLNEKSEQDFVYSSTRSGIKKLLVKDIIYFKAEDKYIKAHAFDGELSINSTLQLLHDKYAEKFVRVHRKYLVAIKSLKELVKAENGKYYLVLENSTEKLPVSRRKLPSVRKVLLGK